MSDRRRERNRRGLDTKPATWKSRKWQGSGIAAIVILIAAMFAVFQLDEKAEVPPHEGETVPFFALNDGQGREVSLETVLAEHEAAVLVFYRGFF